MTEEEAVQKMADMLKAQKGDTEVIHAEADEILLDFLRANGFERIAQAWEDAEKSEGGFWYA